MKPTLTDEQLDSLYAQFCERLTAQGEANARLCLARFALLAIVEIANPERLAALIEQATTLPPALDSPLP